MARPSTLPRTWAPPPAFAPDLGLAATGGLLVMGGGMVGWGPLLGVGMFALAVVGAIREPSPDVVSRLLAATGALAAWLSVASARGDGDPLLLVALLTWAAGLLLGARSSGKRPFRFILISAWILALGALLALATDAPGLVHETSTMRRAAGHVGSPGALGVLCALAIPVAVGTESSGLRHRARLGMLLTFAAGLAATGSRAGLLAAIAGLWVVRRALGRHAVVALTSGGALGLLVMTTASSPAALAVLGIGAVVADRLADVSARAAVGIVGALGAAGSAAVLLGELPIRTADTRTALWSVGIREVWSSPLLGGGLGTQRAASTDTVLHVTRYLHNEPLELLAGAGVVGLGLFVVLLHGTRRALRSTATPDVRAALLAVLVASFFDFTFHMPAITAVCGLLVGDTLRSNRPCISVTAASSSSARPSPFSPSRRVP